MVSDPGNISMSIHDSKRNLSKLKVIEATFKNESGREIPITKISYEEHYGKDFAIVKFYYENGSYTDGKPFTTTLKLSVESESLLISGKFSTHSHTKIEYLPEVLDHG
jgi:hypothetical protein